MLGQQRHHLVRAVARPLLQEPAHLEVLTRAYRLGKHLVGDVANQHVLERQLGLALVLAGGLGDHDVLLLQGEQRLVQVAALLLGHHRERLLPERPADHGRLLHHAALERVQRVQPGGQQCLHRVRQVGGAGAALLHQPAHHLLGEERVAARALGHQRDDVVPPAAAAR